MIGAASSLAPDPRRRQGADCSCPGGVMSPRRRTPGGVCRLAIALFWSAAAAACGSESAGFADVPSAPTAVQAAEPFRIEMDPPAVTGGVPTRATVMLSLPAPAGGLTLQLSSSGPAAGVPPAVVVPAGRDSIDVMVNTQPVSADTEVTVRAAAGTRSIEATVAVWAVFDNFLWSVRRDPLNPGRSRVVRYTPASAHFYAGCTHFGVIVAAYGPEWGWVDVRVSAPSGRPLAAGTYEHAEYLATTDRPALSVDGCGSDGRFVVHDVSITPQGTVPRLWVSFETQCGTSGPVRGEVRATGAPDGYQATASNTCPG